MSSVKPGMRFRSVIADANPLWEVKRSLGRGSWLCVCVDEPWVHDGKTYPGEHAGIERAYLSQLILAAVDMENMFTDLMNEHDQFYANLKIGQIVHYHNGFGEYVRCEVVHGKDKEGKEGNVLLPIALVGAWREYDLPKRGPDGEIQWGYHAQEIIDKKTMTPNYSNIFESVRFQPRNDVDPTVLEPLSLEVPTLDEEKAETARLYRLRQRVADRVANWGYTDHRTVLLDVVKLIKEELK